MILYRDNYLFGCGCPSETIVEKVIAYETKVLGNADVLYGIMETLYHGNNPMWQKVCAYVAEIESNGCIEDLSDEEWEEECRKMLDEVGKITHTPILHCLWLTDRESVITCYGGDEERLCAYETGHIVLADLGEEGKLYGYDKVPVPCN